MSDEKWGRTKGIVDDALKLDPEERARFLDKICGSDHELRREVESLLAADTDRVGFLDRPLFADTDQAEGASLSDRIGPYRLVRELGRGGLGVVYLAERADDEYDRMVAIKLLKRGLDTDEILRKFRIERQILANLRHPNIAIMLDGGTTADGRPYFVMEYVEGEPLVQYCNSHELSLAERLRLFRKVCAAVQFAHQNLIVHRDLKPSNILVTDQGEPRLLDFGIAKLLTPDSLDTTTVHLRPMTPEYASPEQIKGEAITTASDVYSLGVLLCQLLTGRRPYELPSRAEEELRKVICEQELQRPSILAVQERKAPQEDSQQVSRVGVPNGEKQRLRRLLTGDLDNIILMALQKEPLRRYPSVEELSADIGRHLKNVPVLARKDTFLYRMAKFTRRNRFRLVVATLVLSIITGFLVDHEMQQREVARERDKFERITLFMKGVFEISDPYKANGETVTARELLDQAAQKIRNELADEPEMCADLMQTIVSFRQACMTASEPARYRRCPPQRLRRTADAAAPRFFPRPSE